MFIITTGKKSKKSFIGKDGGPNGYSLVGDREKAKHFYSFGYAFRSAQKLLENIKGVLFVIPAKKDNFIHYIEVTYLAGKSQVFIVEASGKRAAINTFLPTLPRGVKDVKVIEVCAAYKII